MIDHKGFLWIAHSMGVSRYDGVSFTNFVNPQESAISMTDLIEDKYGRIWYHNFNGQIFYIQNEKAYYLKEYDFKIEKLFPRMVLCGDEIIISSLTGLFVCNTKTMHCKYIAADSRVSKDLGIHDLCLFNGKVLAYAGRDGWYLYSKSQGLKHLNQRNIFPINRDADVAKLEPAALGDTAFLVNNPAGLLYAITIRNDSVIPIVKKNISSYINTVTIANNNVWINTISGSYSFYGNDTIKNYNISHVLPGKRGSIWISGLTNGLLFYGKTPLWSKLQPNNLQAGDYINCIKRINNKFIFCSQLGDVFIANNPLSKKYFLVGSILRNKGYPENIESVFGRYSFIELSKGLYVLNDSLKRLRHLNDIAVKNISLNGNTLFYSSAPGMFIVDIREWGLINSAKGHPLFFADSVLYINTELKIRSIKKSGRCRSVMFDSSSVSLYISFSDGLYKYTQSKLIPLLFKGQPLYVSSMSPCGHKIYAATFNKGLFVIQKGTLKKIDDDARLPLDAIVKIKCCNTHLWIFRTHDIQVLDTKTDTYINIPPLPVDIAEVTDVEEDSGYIYIATYRGLYAIAHSAIVNESKTPITLLYTLINNRDTAYNNNNTVASHQNNLLFRLAVPVYENAERVHFKYALMSGGNDTTWYYTQDAQRDIQFNALKPGHYTFEAIAVKDEEVISTAPLLYSFTIKQPWFNTWWFYTAVILIIITALLTLQQYRLRQVLKIETIRRKISNDLHDDIGSTLSSINVYSQLAKTEEDNKGYINTIQQNAVTIINNLDDLVWNINPKNDVLDNIIVRMQLFAEPLLTQNNIYYEFNVDAENLQITLTPNLRTNLYLLFKEVINNVIKHSHCTTCTIRMVQKGKHLNLTIKDNGKGFIPQLQSKHRNGLHNMQQRVSDIKGSISINSRPGSGTEITVTCRLK